MQYFTRSCACQPVPLLPIRRVGYAVWVGHHPSCSKKKKKKNLHAIPTSARGWMQMIIIDGQLCPWKDIRNPAPKKNKKKMKTKPVRHFQVGYIHNPVKLFWVLRLMCFNVGNNFTTTNACNILSEFPCYLTKVSHCFNTNKTKKQQQQLMVLVAMVTAN